MVVVRDAVCDADLESWRRVFQVVVPNERAPTVAELRARGGPEVLRVLAEVGGQVVGSGYAGRSDLTAAAAASVRVIPSARRNGVGTAVLHALAGHIGSPGVGVVNANLEDPGSLAFAERFGFAEYDRQVEQVRTVGTEPEPRIPDGVRIVSVAQRPELWREAYRTVGAQAFVDMALDRPLQTSLVEWERDWISDPAAMFLALAGGEVIGCAGLILDADRPDRAENALTAVLRDWRGRGVAAALKRTTLAWAARHGIAEVYTWTQRGNADMRRLNEHLGYVTRTESISVRASLPLPV